MDYFGNYVLGAGKLFFVACLLELDGWLRYNINHGIHGLGLKPAKAVGDAQLVQGNAHRLSWKSWCCVLLFIVIVDVVDAVDHDEHETVM